MLLIFSTRPVMHFTVTNDENSLKPKRFWPWSSFYGQSSKCLFVGVVELFELMEVGMFCMFRGLNIVGSVRNRTVSVDPLGPVQTSNFTCAELNARVKCM